MAKTYLQLVNKVLARLRGDQVGSVSSSAYSALIGEFVNDAKKVVENSWNWGTLRNTATISITPSTRTYNLTTSASVSGSNLRPNERSLLLYARDITLPDPFSLTQYPIDYVQEQYDLSSTPQTTPTPCGYGIYTYQDNYFIELLETPTTARTWKFVFKRPQDDLSNDSDVLLVPYDPVVLLATNYALNERGEEIGSPGSEAEKKYLNALADATALDSTLYGKEVVFTNE